MTITEFLLARLSEAEKEAEAAREAPPDIERVVRLGHSEYAPASDVPGGELADVGRWVRLSTDPVRVMADGYWDESEPVGAAYYVAEILNNHEGVLRHILSNDPAHVLADCKAKRRIVLDCEERLAIAATDSTPESQWVAQFASEILWSLAFPFSDHADFDEAWRP